MDLESAVRKEIESALSELEIAIRLDGDKDLEIKVLYQGEEICSDYVVLDDVFLTIEP